MQRAANPSMQEAGPGKRALALAGLIAVTAIWGFTFVLVKRTVEVVDVYYFLFLRFTLAAGLMAVVFHSRLRHPARSTIVSAFLLSLFIFSAFATQTEGLRITTATNSSLISGMYMVMVPIFSLIYPKRKSGVLAVIGIAIAAPGLFMLTGFAPAGLNIGDLLTLGCAAAFAWHIILTGQFASRHNVVQLVVFQLAFVALFSGLTVLIKSSPITALPPVGWITVAVTAVFATAFAFTMQTWAQRIVDPTRIGIIFALEAVFGAFFGWCIGGEILTPLSFVGACLMVAGMAISEIKPLAKYAMEKLFS